MKKILLGLISLLIVILIIVLIRTFSIQSFQIAVAPVNQIEINKQAVAERLAGAIRIPTVSQDDPELMDYTPFITLHSYLEKSFPLVHDRLERTVINDYSLLYKWSGTDPSLNPILLMAHLDVVPVDTLSLTEWFHPPFSGIVNEAFIWGRGTIDDKAGVLSILEAVELLLEQGFQPKRTVLLAFGHDEEIGGENGAKWIADALQKQGIKLQLILDEGGSIISGAMPGIQNPVALIGIAEKGYVTVNLKVVSAGGHSSMPPDETAIGIMSDAVHNLETNPLSADLTQPVRQMFTVLAPEMDFSKRIIFTNMWLFGSLIKKLLAAKNTTNAMIRTTTALTMFNAGIKENVLPMEATATVNFRLRPGNTVADVLNHVVKVVDDPRVEIRTQDRFFREASTVSDIGSQYYRILSKTVRQIFPDAVVTPWLTVGGTDTKHYVDLCENIYRFLPVHISSEDVNRIHGINERISLESYLGSIAFYAQFVQNNTR